MATLHITDVRPLADRRDDLLEQLTPERRAKALRPLGERDRLLSLGAGLLLMRSFGPKAKNLRYDRIGKPFFDDGPFLSLSHSGFFSALAIDPNRPIGCDVQCREKISPEIIAKRFFHPAERDLLRETVEEDRESLFYRLWTLKESYLKMLGCGFTLPPNRVRFALAPTVQLVETPVEGPRPFFFTERIDSLHTLAVCSASPFTPQEVERVLF